jgi:hypothetical protein
VPTLGDVTAPSGDDADSRFTAALDRFLQGRERPSSALAGDAGGDRAEGLDSGPVEGAANPPAGSNPDVDEYVLPEIVPATADVPLQPELPPRPSRPTPAVVPVMPAISVPPPPQPGVPPPAPVSAAPAGGWGQAVPTRAARPSAQLRAPGRRPRVRRVTRVVRHVDPWSVFKVAIVFSGVGYLVVLTSGVLLWRVAESTGTLDNVERWFTQFGWETFELKGDEVFSNAWVIGLFIAVGLTGAAVLMATLFNLVSDIVGGVRVTVLEEEVVERTASSARRYVVRRPPLAEQGGAAGAAAWEVDDDEPVGPPPAVTRPTPSPNAATAATRRATTGTTDWSLDD